MIYIYILLRGKPRMSFVTSQHEINFVNNTSKFKRKPKRNGQITSSLSVSASVSISVDKIFEFLAGRSPSGNCSPRSMLSSGSYNESLLISETHKLNLISRSDSTFLASFGSKLLPLEGPSVQTQHFGDRTSTLGPSKGRSLDPKEAKKVESDLEIKLSLCVSDISSDSLYDPDDNIDLGLQLPEGLRPARNSNILSTEIDTEAETDKEDVI
jgi:hypothetical protein